MAWAPEAPDQVQPELVREPIRLTWPLVIGVLLGVLVLGTWLGLHVPRPLTASECVKGGGYQVVSGGRAVCQLDVTLPEAPR